MVVRGGNGRLDRVAAMPKQAVESDSGLRGASLCLGDARMPICWVLAVTNPSTSGVPLVQQPLGGVEA